MSSALHREATVGLDGKITISVPELQPGQHVTVTIEPETPSEPSGPSQTGEVSMHDLVKDLPGHLLFNTAEEVDEYLRQERESWDR